MNEPIINTDETTIHCVLSFAKGLVKLLGAETEVVVHDLIQKKIIFIENGYITNRTIDSPEDHALIETIINLADKDGHLIGFNGASASGKKLRTSHFVFRDADQVPIALICINQDVTNVYNLREQLNRFLDTRLLEDEVPVKEGEENYIQAITKRTIFQEIEQVKPSRLEYKETKLRVLATLEEKGIFDVKDAVSLVCEQLSISQATLYNYLREIRNDQ